MTDDESFHSACDMSLSFCSLDSSVSEPDTLGDCMKRTFPENSKLLNICHLNAQSIPSHYNDFLDAFQSCNAHAVLVSETWFKPSLPSTSFGLPGYVLLRNDRTGKGGGGVAIYLRSDIQFKILSSSPSQYSESMEHLFLEITVGGTLVALGVVYCPPTIDYFSDFETVLAPFSTDYAHQLILGDFNTDLLKNNPRTRKFNSAIESVDLSVLPLKPTHHNADTSDSWLDLILASSVDHINQFGQLSAPGFSHHDLIYLSYKVRPPKPRNIYVQLRSFARLDMDALRRDAGLEDWSATFSAPSVDEAVTLLCSGITKLFDKHAPVRSVRLKRAPAPWITVGVRMAMTRRDRAFRKYKGDRCEENWNLFKIARNRCNQMVRAAKRKYIHENIVTTSPASTWKFLNSIGIGKVRNDSLLTSSFSLNDLNNHFASTSSLDKDTVTQCISHINALPCRPITSFSFTLATDDEILKVIKSIKSNAVGHDDLSRLMIMCILECILPVLTHVINLSLSSGVFPSLWRSAYVIPLPKISNPGSLKDFRPISILPFMSKVIEAVVHKQLSAHVYTNNVLSPYQSGFRPGHSTTTALLKVVEDVRQGMDTTQLTVLVLIDFSNAFNAVNHELLLATLHNLNVSTSVAEWFTSYLQGRRQMVRVDRSFSDWCDITSGVPQGGILSPLLFSIFINLVVPQIICSHHLYADDLQLYTQASVDDLNRAVTDINADLDRISAWSRSFGIAVNPSKCQAIVLGSPRIISSVDLSLMAPIMYESEQILLVPKVKNLGLILDCGLTGEPQVSDVCRRVTYTLRCLYRFKYFLPISTKILLVQTLVIPKIDYADVCFSNLTQGSLSRLDRLLNNCIRFIFGLRKYDHISAYRRQLNWLPIRERRSLRVLCTLYSCLFDPAAPDYLRSKFQFVTARPGCNLRTARSLKLVTPLHRTGFMTNSFSAQAIRLWNALPIAIRQAQSKYSFKNMLRKHFLDSLN